MVMAMVMAMALAMAMAMATATASARRGKRRCVPSRAETAETERKGVHVRPMRPGETGATGKTAKMKVSALQEAILNRSSTRTVGCALVPSAEGNGSARRSVFGGTWHGMGPAANECQTDPTADSCEEYLQVCESKRGQHGMWRRQEVL